MRSADGSAWWRDGGSNYRVPIPRPGAQRAEGPAATDALSRAIIAMEDASQVTLMHRFNKASELLGEVMKVRARRASPTCSWLNSINQ